MKNTEITPCDNETMRGKLNAANCKVFKQFMTSPKMLFNYIASTGREYDLSADGFDMYIECPAIVLHDAFDPDMRGFGAHNTSLIFTERGNGKAILSCAICGASWDIFSLFQLDNKIGRNNAILTLENAFLKPEVWARIAKNKITGWKMQKIFKAASRQARAFERKHPANDKGTYAFWHGDYQSWEPDEETRELPPVIVT